MKFFTIFTMSFTPDPSLRDHLELTYPELEKFNLEQKIQQSAGKDEKFFEKKIENFLEKQPKIKAVTVCFSDLEGKLQMLDYDKKFFLGALENLTFDGSSIKGFTELGSSDLRLKVDFGSFRLLPSDIFGSGKSIVFSTIRDKDGSQFPSDFRGVLKQRLEKLQKEEKITYLMAPEVEGFLMKGVDQEQHFNEDDGFEIATLGGYFNALPQDDLRKFIDTVAEVQRALGFENEKDHGEVAPAQFEMNFKYADALITADQILLYKLIARQVAKLMGFTATFLPKPVAGINGSGMHSNMSLAKGGKNIFFDENGEDFLSEIGHKFCTGVLSKAKEMNALYCPSVNSFRRLDPNFEAPNAIQKSSCDRGSIVRIPLGNEKSARIELRPVSPDANPYLVFFAILEAGLSGVHADTKSLAETRKILAKKPVKKLYGTFHDALAGYKSSAFLKEVLGQKPHAKYYEIKKSVIDRAPKALGNKIKTGEVIFHHEVTNQVLWNEF